VRMKLLYILLILVLTFFPCSGGKKAKPAPVVESTPAAVKATPPERKKIAASSSQTRTALRTIVSAVSTSVEQQQYDSDLAQRLENIKGLRRANSNSSSGSVKVKKETNSSSSDSSGAIRRAINLNAPSNHRQPSLPCDSEDNIEGDLEDFEGAFQGLNGADSSFNVNLFETDDLAKDNPGKDLQTDSSGEYVYRNQLLLSNNSF
jgi:hypothetical protein